MFLFSRQGKLRLQRWYTPFPQKERKKFTRDLLTTILSRKHRMCSFLEYKDMKVVYKRWVINPLFHQLERIFKQRWDWPDMVLSLE